MTPGIGFSPPTTQLEIRMWRKLKTGLFVIHSPSWTNCPHYHFNYDESGNIPKAFSLCLVDFESPWLAYKRSEQR
ncbi:unnamed protein product [Menidia menidia]|uniref:(Atlantic silverside) hypothetical protein n=1 Tax=Menidia menidia TaxID=238744 RepID=A0A8S4BTD2_9TELE|nr:unnamed protein product [Menidia menidia]